MNSTAYRRINSRKRTSKKDIRLEDYLEGGHNKVNIIRYIDLAIKWITIGLVFIIPLLFLPFISNYYELAKQIFLVTLTSILLILWSSKAIILKELKIARTSIGIFLILFILSLGLSVYFSIDKLTSFWGDYNNYGGLADYICYTLVFFIIISNFTKLKDLFYFVSSYILSALILGIISILQGFKLYIFPLSETHNVYWSPMGNPLQVLIYIISALIVLITIIFYLRENKEIDFSLNKFYNASFVALAILIIACISNVIQFFHLPLGFIIPVNESWNISISTIGDHPFMGSGLDTYLLDFYKYRSITFVSGNLGSLIFNKASTEILEILTTTGVLGIVILSLTFVFFLRLFRQNINNDNYLKQRNVLRGIGLAVIFLLISMLFIYFNITLYLCLFILLSLYSCFLYAEDEIPSFNLDLSLHDGQGYNLSTLLVPLIGLGISIYAIYYVSNILIADIQYKSALTAIQNKKNDLEILNDMQSAVGTYKYQPVYWEALSNLDFNIANYLNSSNNSKDASSKTAQSYISKFLSGSISNGNNAVSLEPSNPIYIQHIGDIYKGLMGASSSQGTPDQTALSAYIKAYSHDPNDPILFEDAGEVFLYEKKYSNALGVLQQALNLRSDFPKASYNLALVYIGLASTTQSSVDKKTYLNSSISQLKIVLKSSEVSKTERGQIQSMLNALESQISHLK